MADSESRWSRTVKAKTKNRQPPVAPPGRCRLDVPDKPEPFDPYLQWLGIRSPRRPPDYYSLLGVEPFEGDPDVLSNAADRQAAYVRTFQTGKHSAESQEVLNALAKAKLCLLDAEKKLRYDAKLRIEQKVADRRVKAVQPKLPVPGRCRSDLPPVRSTPPAESRTHFPNRDTSAGRMTMGWFLTVVFFVVAAAVALRIIGELAYDGIEQVPVTSPEIVPKPYRYNDSTLKAGKAIHETEAQVREGILKETLGNVVSEEDVAWIHFEDNNVYVGFTEVPLDLNSLLRAWALQGNRAIDFGVHVWAVPADAPRGSVERTYAEATARYGKIED